MKKRNRIFALLLAVAMLASLTMTSALAVVEGENNVQVSKKFGTSMMERAKAIAENYPELVEDAGFDLESAEVTMGEITLEKIENPNFDLKETADSLKDLTVSQYAEDELVRVIVVLDEASLLDQGYTTEQIASGAAANKIKAMDKRQKAIVNEINDLVQERFVSLMGEADQVESKYNYHVAISGIAVEMPYGVLEDVRELAGVETAFVVPVYSLPEDMSDANDPNMYATQNSFGSAQTWQELGYTGEGMRIAIVDTGLDEDHPSFAAEPPLNEDSLTVAEIESVLPNTNAYAMWKYMTDTDLTADQVYRSGKVPYGFNYVDRGLDITHDNDQQGDHGTHVAGIAAANKMDGTEVVGVAPDAQILVMKVFGYYGGAYMDDILAALEDCFYLNVDVVNMSLGSPAGFVYEGEDYSDAIYKMIEQSDMIAAISAGNSTSAAYMNQLGTDLNFTADPDNGIVSSPATYPGTTVVASLENESVKSNYMLVAGNQIAYNDVGAQSFGALEGEHTYVMIPGYGDVSDYEGLDVAGKIAVVMRGTLDFVTKQENAAAAGAIACIVYDNVDGDMINMMDAEKIPNVFITKANGAIMAENADENGEGTLEIMPVDQLMTTPSTLAGTMSSFSSWGVTPDLELVPDVTAPGGNIYSTLNNGKYGTMSGTSMSAPHIAGMSALVLQYLRDEYDLSDKRAHTIAEALIMSTAEPVVEYVDEYGTAYYSPRKQGAGNANVYKAVDSKAYLSVDGNTPKVSLGDDDAKAGVYTFEFDINNLSDDQLTYRLEGTTMTDYVLPYGPYAFMSEMSMTLEAGMVFSAYIAPSLDYDADQDGDTDLDDVQYMVHSVNGVKPALPVTDFDINHDDILNTADAQALYELLTNPPSVQQVTIDEGGTLSVPANSKVTVSTTVTLSDWDKSYMDYYYPNGIYVDGFVRCYSQDGGSDLSLPFMGFYGDWSQADVFDDGWYFEEDEVLFGTDTTFGEINRYVSCLWTEEGYYLMGLDPYIDEAYDPSHNVLSPNGDGYGDAITEMYVSMMRSAKALEFTWTDSESNELWSNTAPYVRKSYYSEANGINLPFVYSWYLEGYYDMTDAEGNFLDDGTDLTLTISAWLDDGDEEMDETISFPVHIDTITPELVDVETIVDKENDARSVKVTVSDNYDVSSIITVSAAGELIEAFPVHGEMTENGEVATVEFDVSKYDAEFYVVVSDYGLNQSTFYAVTAEGKHNVNSDRFYGYTRQQLISDGNYLYLIDAYNGWASFETPDDLTMHSLMYDNNETPVAAAEYIDGYVFGVDTEGTIFVVKSGKWSNRIELGTLSAGWNDYVALDMAYDYSTDTLYVLTDEQYAGAGGHLLTIDYMTGEVTDLGVIKMPEGHAGQALTLACDNDGVLYTVSYVGDYSAETYAEDMGDLYIIDQNDIVASENWWEDSYVNVKYVGETDYVPLDYQSMTVDHETNELYWIAYTSPYDEVPAYFFLVDKTTGELEVISDVEWSSQVVGLFKPFIPEETIIPVAELEAITLNKTSIAMSVGAYDELICNPVPFNADLGEVVWTSSDEAVVYVEDGIVVAMGEGTATVTATAGECTAECIVDVVDLEGVLTVCDSGNTYMWQRFEALDPASAEYVEGGIDPANGTTAAAYFNGWVYVGEYGGGFYRVDPETMQGNRIGSSDATLLAMAFNYADGYMYGIEQYQASMWEPAENYLVRINLNNGELERVGKFSDTYNPLGGLAIDYNGNFYSVCGNNETWGYELVRWAVTEYGVEAEMFWSMDAWPTNGYGSMTYSADNEGLFWANSEGQLLWIDENSLTEDNYEPRVVLIDYIGEFTGYAMNMGLFMIPAEEPALPETTVTEVSVSGSYLLLEGGSVTAGVSVMPWNAYPTITYTMADEAIAVVDENGNITGVAEGETKLTVEVAGWNEIYEIPVTVVASVGELRGFLITDFMYTSNYFISFADTDPTNEIAVVSDEMAFAVYAGAYYDGVIYGYGQDQTGEYSYKNFFLTIDAETFELVKGEKIHYTLRDMAMDYTTGNLYAIAEGGSYDGAVAQVDMTTGEVSIIADLGMSFAAMTITADGQMYAIAESDSLYKINKNTGELTEIGYTGVDAGQVFQSMHCDYESGNVYWAQVADDQTSSLRIVDLETGSTTDLGTICPNGAMVGAMYTVPSNEPNQPDEETFEITGIQLEETQTVAVGESVQLDATVLTSVELVSLNSLSSTEAEITWVSADETIATVEDGLVTGVAAGEVVITATAGDYSAECLVTVTAEARKFYAYDKSNNQWISFSGEDTTAVTVERADTEGEAQIQASYYTGETIYAYDADGQFYTIDPETFERTAVGEGIGTTAMMEFEQYDYWTGETVAVEIDAVMTIVDLAYDNDTLYAAVFLENEEYWAQTARICTVDVETGELTTIYESMEMKPANLLVDGDRAFFVDAYMSGMLTYVDLADAEAAPVEAALVQGYWGDIESSVGLFRDELTGEIYAIRDLTDTDGSYDYETWTPIPWDGVTGDATLCTLNMADADIVELGKIGENLVVSGLFIK